MINWLYEKTRFKPLLRFYDTPTTLIPDPMDGRDYIFEWDSTLTLPASVDLREHTGQIEDQLSTGSCTANALVSACELYLIAAGQHTDTPATDANDLSRLFNYYNSRQSLGGKYAEQDLGSTARESLRSARNHGLPSEQLWPYDVTKWNTKPSDAAYSQTTKIGRYERIEHTDTTRTQIRYAIAHGWPVMIGMNVGEKLYNLKPGEIYPYKHKVSNPPIGGHEMLIVGYDGDDYIIENSWGKDWCDNGYFRCQAAVVYVDMIDAWVVKGFAGYDSINSTEAMVKKAYRDLLHREAEPGGLAYWSAEIDAGRLTRIELMRALARSVEFKDLHQTIESLYQDLLLREPDAGGLAAWKASGLSIPQVTEYFLISQEFTMRF